MNTARTCSILSLSNFLTVHCVATLHFFEVLVSLKSVRAPTPAATIFA
jgi:hypothetical protein